MKKSLTFIALALLFSSQVSIAQCSRTGNFVRNGADTPTSGSATLIFQADGAKQVILGSNFSTSNNGPDIHVILCRTFRYEPKTDLIISGVLTKTSGMQTFNVPAEVQLSDFQYILIHCVAYNHRFGYAKLGNTTGQNCATLGVNDFDTNANSIKIFPNPTDDILNFSINEEAEVSIYNVSGKKINSNTLTKENNTVSLQSQSNGVYIVEINSNNQRTTQRIVKKQ